MKLVILFGTFLATEIGVPKPEAPKKNRQLSTNVPSQLEVQKLTVDGGAVGLVRRSPSNVGLHTRVRSQLAILCWLTAIKNVDYAKSPLTTSSYLSCADNLCDQAPRYRNQHWFLKSFFKMGTSRPLFHLF